MSQLKSSSWKFEIGNVFATRGVENDIAPEEVARAMQRHVRGDWGLVSEQDRLANEFALDKYLRLMSVYEDSKAKRFWIITEADHGVTAFLLPKIIKADAGA